MTTMCSWKTLSQVKTFFFIFPIFFSTYSCASCHLSCLTCNGSSESQCITCRSGRFSYDGKCLNSCPDGYYGDKKRQECMACPTGCATCSNNGFCLTCKENWMKNKKNRCIASGSENCDECKWISMFFGIFILFYRIFYSYVLYSLSLSLKHTGFIKTRVSFFVYLHLIYV